MANIKSEKVLIYPAASRNPGYDPISNLNIERNIVRNIRGITDYPNYIVSSSSLNISESKKLVLGSANYVLGGYNVILKGDSYDLPSDLPKEANLNIYLVLTLSSTEVGTGVKVSVTHLGANLDKEETSDDSTIYSFSALNIKVTSEELSGGTDDGSEFCLKIGVLDNSGDSPKISSTSGVGKKFKASSSYLNIEENTSLSLPSFEGSVEDWLKNTYIIDDGEIA